MTTTFFYFICVLIQYKKPPSILKLEGEAKKERATIPITNEVVIFSYLFSLLVLILSTSSFSCCIEYSFLE